MAFYPIKKKWHDGQIRKLNRNIPQMRDIWGAWIFRVDQYRDFAGNHHLQEGSGTSTEKQIQDGRQILFTDDSPHTYLKTAAGAHSTITDTTEFTVVIISTYQDTSGGGWEPLFSWGSNLWTLYVSNSGGSLVSVYDGGENNTQFSKPGVGDRHMYTMTQNSSAVVDIWEDTTEDTSVVTMTGQSTDGQFLIGASTYSGEGLNQWTEACFIWDRVLTDDEIKWIYQKLKVEEDYDSIFEPQTIWFPYEAAATTTAFYPIPKKRLGKHNKILDRTHPLAPDVGCWLMNEQPIRNLVDNSTATQSGTPDVVAGPYGLDQKTGRGDAKYYDTGIEDSDINDDYTILIIWTPSATAGTSVWTSITSWAKFGTFHWDNATGGGRHRAFVVRDNGSWTPAQWSQSSGERAVIVGRLDTSGTDEIRVFKNGVSADSANITINRGSNEYLYIFNNQDEDGAVPGTLELVCLWNRSLSFAEIKWISQELYRGNYYFLRSEPIWFPLGAAAGGTPVEEEILKAIFPWTAQSFNADSVVLPSTTTFPFSTNALSVDEAIPVTATTFNFTAQNFTVQAAVDETINAATFVFNAQDVFAPFSIQIDGTTFPWTEQTLTEYIDITEEITTAVFTWAAQNFNVNAAVDETITATTFPTEGKPLIDAVGGVIEQITSTTFPFTEQNLTDVQSYIEQIDATTFPFNPRTITETGAEIAARLIGGNTRRRKRRMGRH